MRSLLIIDNERIIVLTFYVITALLNQHDNFSQHILNIKVTNNIFFKKVI